MISWKKVIAAGLTAVLSMNIVNVTFGKENEYIYADPFETPNLTGVWRTDIIAVAESQMGYTEAEDGSTYFGAWIGTGDPAQAWCSEFASWCAYKAGIPERVFPRKTSSRRFQEYFHKQGRFFFLEGGIRPEESGYGKSNAKTISPDELKPGDILLVDTNMNFEDGADHTALVIGLEGEKIRTISGNVSNSVRKKSYTINRVHGVCKPAYEQEQNQEYGSSVATDSNASHSSSSSRGKSGGGSGGSKSTTGGAGASGGLNAIPVLTGTWFKDDIGWWLQKPDKSYPKNQWAKIHDAVYRFNEAGYMAEGWLMDNGKWYYLLPGNGARATGWIQLENIWYYLNADGSMAVGWVQDTGKWYYLGSDGTMLVNAITPDNYVVGPDGVWIP